jgi:hypothetical protein
LDARLMAALRRHWPMAMLWLIASALLIWVCWDRIVSRAGWDPDDQLRMVQLRDFLGGQSWFDTTQYRMNPPGGAPMHWSRLVELPLALLVLVFTPLIGADSAEMVAGTLLPLLCLGGIACLLASIGNKIGGRPVAILTFWLTLIAPALLIQLRPMRIDHHGWQIFCAVLGFASLYWENGRKAGLVLGAALAVWMHISLEGAPMTAAFFFYLGWLWAMGRDPAKRLLWTLGSFTALSILLFLGTQPLGFAASQYCDTVSPVHIWAILGAAAVLVPSTYRPSSQRIIRFALTALAGVVAVAILLSMAPHCTQGAFGDLDPVVRSYWYDNVREGLPAWRQEGQTAVSLMTPLLVALIGLAVVWRFSASGKNAALATASFFLVYASILSLLVFRTVSVATAFAIVPSAYCIVAAFNAYRAEPRLWLRLSLVPAVIALMASGLIGGALYSAFGGKAKHAVSMKAAPAEGCGAKASEAMRSVKTLGQLPPSNLVAPFNLGPAILVTTRHRVLASSHHRNRAGMRDQIDLFRLPPDQAKAIIDRRGIAYIVACPVDAEMERYRKRAPLGLWGQIEADKAPEWLEYRGELGRGLKVWRVKASAG